MKAIILLLILFNFCNLTAQHSNSWGLELKAKGGILIAHRGVMAHLPVDYAKAIEISAFFESTGNRSWHKPYKYPTYGFSYFIGSVGNNEILGNFQGLYGFIELPFFNRNHFKFSSKVAAGLGYGSKIYDPVHNPKNPGISTHFNALICLGLKTEYLWNKNKVGFTLDLTHFSNGANKTPNLGLNLPYLGFSYGRYIRKNNQIDTTYNVEPYRVFELIAIYSQQQVFPSGGRTFSIYGLNAHYQKIFNEKTGFEAGLDLLSKQSILIYKDIEKTQKDIWQLGGYAAYILPFDRFKLIIGMGAYIRDKYNPNDLFYHRVGMRYSITEHLLANLTLKSHWAKADYVEWGLGYTF